MTAIRHRLAWLAAWWVLLVAGFAPQVLAADAPLPASPSPHYIRDDAGWLSPSAFQALDAKLKAFERETSSQFVVAILPRVPPGEELFDFSQRLYQAWQPGSAAKDNGALFLIFADDRKMRIHTGYGMEGVLPDARCKQIIQDVVAPQLRQGNREAAVNAGVDAMIAAAKGEYTGDGTTRLDGQPTENSGGWFPLLFLGIIGIFIVHGISTGTFTLADVIFTILGATRGGRSGGGSSGWGGGGGSSGGGWSGGGGGGFSGGGGSSGGGGASGGW